MAVLLRHDGAPTFVDQLEAGTKFCARVASAETTPSGPSLQLRTAAEPYTTGGAQLYRHVYGLWW